MDEVHGADVQGRWDAHTPAELDEALDEIETNLPVVEAAVDVGGLRVDEALGLNCPSEADEEPHREPGCLAVISAQEVVIGRRKDE